MRNNHDELQRLNDEFGEIAALLLAEVERADGAVTVVRDKQLRVVGALRKAADDLEARVLARPLEKEAT